MVNDRLDTNERNYLNLLIKVVQNERDYKRSYESLYSEVTKYSREVSRFKDAFSEIKQCVVNTKSQKFRKKLHNCYMIGNNVFTQKIDFNI